MRTTILAYVIALEGVVMIIAGAWDIYVMYSDAYRDEIQLTLSDYALPIRTISGGPIAVRHRDSQRPDPLGTVGGPGLVISTTRAVGCWDCQPSIYPRPYCYFFMRRRLRRNA